MFDLINGLLDKCLPLGTLYGNEASQTAVFLGIQIPKGEVLQLPLEFIDSKAMSQRHINFHCFLSNALLLVRAQILQRPHIVQTVCEFDKDHAQICSHGKKDFADVLQIVLFP